MKNVKKKTDKKPAAQKRWFKREMDEGLRDAYLGPCPACRGSVFGALDEARCRDCGWNNDENQFERGAA
jgi:hypothetical protein